MRSLPPTFAFLLLAAPAFAASLEPVAGAPASSGSISTITCDTCPALKPKAKSDSYHVDAIEPGTQKVEIREENGERRIFRTEAWMGGSPVTFVSKAPAEKVEAADGAAEGPAAPEKVDADARTSALAESAAAAPSREFDPAGFALRLN